MHRESHGRLTATLIARLRAGEPDAGALLQELYREPLLRFCLGYVRRLEDAEDAVQEVFCKVLRSPETPNDFRAWIYRIARNHCLNMVRDRGRRRDQAGLPPECRLEDEASGQLTRLVGGEARSNLGRIMDRLPDPVRELLRMRYADGLTRAEIAAVLDLPESIVKSRLYEGLRKLREYASVLKSA